MMKLMLIAGSPEPSLRINPPDIGSSNEVEDRMLLPTFYPFGIDAAAAQALEIKPGAELTGIDVQVPRLQKRRVRGTVVDAAGQPPRAVKMRLFPPSPSGRGDPSSAPEQTYNPLTGQFELRAVSSGAHTLRVEAMDPALPQAIFPTIQFFTNNVMIGTRPYADSVVAAVDIPINAGDSDLDKLEVTLRPATSISGQVRLENESSADSLAQLQIQLLPVRNGALAANILSVPPPVTNDTRGTFTISNVLFGEYRFGVAMSSNTRGLFQLPTNLPVDTYVKEVRYGLQDVLGKVFTVSPGDSGRIDVVISRRAGQLEGIVVDDQRRRVLGGTVVLAPVQNRERMERMFWSETDQAGHFQLQRIPPGDYKLFAFRELETFAFYDPAVLARYEAQAMPVVIAESSKQNLEVKVMREAP